MVPTPLFPAQLCVLLAYLSTGLLALGVFGYTLSRYGTKARGYFVAAVSFGFRAVGRVAGLHHRRAVRRVRLHRVGAAAVGSAAAWCRSAGSPLRMIALELSRAGRQEALARAAGAGRVGRRASTR